MNNVDNEINGVDIVEKKIVEIVEKEITEIVKKKLLKLSKKKLLKLLKLLKDLLQNQKLL